MHGSPSLSSSAPPPPLPSDIRAHWLLDPSIAFLNHGSFGATPREVLAAQDAYRERIEARPIEMLNRRRAELLGAAKQVVGEFLGMQGSNFGFVTNATGGINAVLRSLRFCPGDELLTTNHVYNAVRKTMQYVAAQHGATYVEVPIPLPLSSPEDVVSVIASAITPRTRMIVIDHVTSPTAIVFPIVKLLALAKERGIDVIIDGAHAPGMLDLNVQSLGCAYYSANLHKWCCAPKGAAFLHVRPDRQSGVHPNTISHFLGEGIVNEFGWQGTRDITSWLAAADAIEFMGGLLPGGWNAVRQHNHSMAVWVQQMLCEAWNVEPATPLDGSMIGSMVTVQLPQGVRRFDTFEALMAEIYKRFAIEIPVVDWDGKWWVRPCCQLYNRAEEYVRLAQAVKDVARV